jgi:predicted RNA-binding Zn ribbon-like protein
MEMKSMAREFQLVAGHVALDFANTLDNRYDPERLVELLPNYRRFLVFASEAGILTPHQARILLGRTNARHATRVLKQIVLLRETLDSLFRSVVAGRPNGSCLPVLNRFLAEARVRQAISFRRGSFILHRADVAATPEGPLWPIVHAAAELLASPNRSRIRECGDKKCRWLFLDRSKNHSRRWCDMRVCGNRWKARRFQARTAGV